MGNNRAEWLQVAVEIGSYRGMYEFAGHIIQSAVATPDDRRAALRLYRCLQDIIDLPIAESSRLMKAHKCFAKLKRSLLSAVADNLGAPLSAGIMPRYECE